MIEGIGLVALGFALGLMLCRWVVRNPPEAWRAYLESLVSDDKQGRT